MVRDEILREMAREIGSVPVLGTSIKEFIGQSKKEINFNISIGFDGVECSKHYKDVLLEFSKNQERIRVFIAITDKTLPPRVRLAINEKYQIISSNNVLNLKLKDEILELNPEEFKEERSKYLETFCSEWGICA